MKNKNIYTLKIMLLFFITGFFISCDEGGDPDPGNSATVDFAGDWYIVGIDPSDGKPAFGGNYNLFSTYNASSNDENFWIDDHGNFFEMKTKVQANFSNNTFSGPTNAPELIKKGTITVSNGKIIKLGVKTPGSKTVVDSIYFEAELSSVPGTKYIFRGHKRTGHLEDENPSL